MKPIYSPHPQGQDPTAEPGIPVRADSQYERKGALHLFAAFDTRTGKVYDTTGERKRQVEFITLLKKLEREIDPFVTAVTSCSTT